MAKKVLRFKLPREVRARCMTHGVDASKAPDGDPRSYRNQYTDHREPNKDPRAIALSKAGECACAMWQGLDPLTAVAWVYDPHDVLACGLSLDVKQTGEWGQLLIWPVNKARKRKYLDEPFDILVMARTVDSLFLMGSSEWDVELCGWVSKDRFYGEHFEAPHVRAPPRIDPGTWFMPVDMLDELEDYWRLTTCRSTQAWCGHRANLWKHRA